MDLHRHRMCGMCSKTFPQLIIGLCPACFREFEESERDISWQAHQEELRAEEYREQVRFDQQRTNTQ
jgi:predicted amidophosphoribosyltransferase